MKRKIGLRLRGKMRTWVLSFSLFSICGVAVYLLLVRVGFLMPLSDWPAVLCLPACQPEGAVHSLPPQEQLLNRDKPLQTLLSSDKREKISVLIEKSKRRLTVFQNLKPVKSYGIVLGGSPVGDKRYEGDMKTPEGIYHLRDLYPHPDWSKFMWINYPTPQSWRKHFQSKFAGEIPWFLPVGSDVGIHGVPQGRDLLIEQGSNWTWGCISLKNSDVDEIYSVVQVGTLVEVVP
jgi:murein L,D-transpeptidase YafK